MSGLKTSWYITDVITSGFYRLKESFYDQMIVSISKKPVGGRKSNLSLHTFPSAGSGGLKPSGVLLGKEQNGRGW